MSLIFDLDILNPKNDKKTWIKGPKGDILFSIKMRWFTITWIKYDIVNKLGGMLKNIRELNRRKEMKRVLAEGIKISNEIMGITCIKCNSTLIINKMEKGEDKSLICPECKTDLLFKYKDDDNFIVRDIDNFIDEKEGEE